METLKTPACPGCGAGNPLPIVYGLPTPEMEQAARRGEIALGGRTIEIEAPTLECSLCERRYAGAIGESRPH